MKTKRESPGYLGMVLLYLVCVVTLVLWLIGGLKGQGTWMVRAEVFNERNASTAGPHRTGQSEDLITGYSGYGVIGD